MTDTPVRDEMVRAGLADDVRYIAAHEKDPRNETVLYEAADTIEALTASQVEAGEVEALREAVRVSAQAFRTLEEVAVAQLEHDKARNFIQLGDRCRAALARKEQP